MLSHAAVMAGLRAILFSSGLTTEDLLVQWIPHHHDMGLFGHLSQILNGAESHVFAPAWFLRHPDCLLRYMSDHRATTLTGPNFAYDLLCNAATPELVAELDLSRWRIAFNGAEPISPVTVARFADVFAPAGVAASVMYPVYGMAEATLPITFPIPGSKPRVVLVDRDELAACGTVTSVKHGHPRAKALVSVGSPVQGIHVRLVDGQGRELGTGRVGEIHIRGPMVTTGYLRDPQATGDLFDDGWLRTGDLGFRLGEDYFVAGRRKEMVVVNGCNYFPQDAEAVARTVPGVFRHRAVAVADTSSDERECIGVIVETTADSMARQQLRDEILRRVVDALGMPYVQVYCVGPHWLTRTTSGKWRRLDAARKLHKEGRR